MAIRITRADPRYAMLQRSRNLRWDGNPAEAAAEIELCETAEQAAEALQRVVNAGMRPTVRSGGHCYEDFVVNNPGGVILDLSLLNRGGLPGDGTRCRVSPRQQLGEVYRDLYKRHGCHDRHRRDENTHRSGQNLAKGHLGRQAVAFVVPVAFVP